jgi:hypothetical protein
MIALDLVADPRLTEGLTVPESVRSTVARA